MPETIKEQVDLPPYTTLGVGGPAEFFAEVRTEAELQAVLTWAKDQNYKVTILGGGSNVLIPDEGIKGLVVRPAFTDITYEEKGDEVLVTAGSGLMLDDLIQILVDKELWGLENLSSIPSMVGGVPIQNVGAYGVEAKDVIKSVEAFDSETFTTKTFLNAECEFAYRDSIFKKEKNKKFFVTNVTFILSKIPKPNIAYADVLNFFGENKNPSIHEIRNAIATIRYKKLPDWNVIGTAGSFFKNPTIPSEHYEELQKLYPEIPGYPADKGLIKVPLGWVLDHVCHLRGYKKGKIGLFENQALVLVCEKGGTADEIKKFANEVSDIVFEKTKIKIENEVTFLF